MNPAAIAGYILAGFVVLAVVVLLVMFALHRRGQRFDAATEDHPAGTALADLPGVVLDADATPTVGAAGPIGPIGPLGARLRRRENMPAIRRAEPGDSARLAEIEAQSDPGLDGSGLGALPASALREGDAPASVLLVAGRPAVAYIRIDEVDGVAHVDQLAVLQSVARQGIGRALLDAGVAWAAQHGYRSMTLSTFADSEWNARVYDPSGFHPLFELTPGLRELRDWERAIGLDALGDRVVMRRELSA